MEPSRVVRISRDGFYRYKRRTDGEGKVLDEEAYGFRILQA